MLTAHSEATHLMFGHQSQCEIAGAKRCRFNRSMQHSSNLLIRLCFQRDLILWAVLN
jgi:hypothetical protein